ncbi:GGDEF/EAL domain-containing response regulator [Catenovulum sediminis]|uniref:EAL domain-containing protein n=1 Tax=Catenovulum sediminis TaxID=1740262 RepID=A0ABV1RK33_9ALTE
MKLLLVNGNQTHCQTIQAQIENTGVYEVVCANSGTEAIQCLRKQNIHALVTDIEIEGLDGWRLSRMVRSGIFRCSANIPIIVLAATWCEHIAETTAREFGINKLIPYENIDQISQVLSDAQSGESSTSDKVSMLVVEDNESIQEIVERILQHRFDVTVAATGEEGIELWSKQNYDIVLLDVMLPGLSGEKVLEHMMAVKPAQAVIIMTAHGTIDMAETMIIQGAADFITKPFRAEQLRRVCEIASRREDFMISNQQFAEKVTELRQREIEYREISQAHQQLLDNMTTVVLELNHKGEVNFINKAWSNLTGFEIHETIQRPFINYVCPKFEAQEGLVFDTINDMLLQQVKNCSLEFKLKHKDGEDIWVEARFSSNSDHDKRSVLTATIDDISKRKSAEFKLEHLALHDTLTGLHNRYYFDNELNRYSKMASRGEGPHALLYIDLDHFKVINDSQGHHQGDMVLKEVASAIKSRLRKSDLLCRIGGDEFALLLSHSSMLDAHELAEEICDTVKSGHYQFNDQVYKLSCSVGVTSINGIAKDGHEYLKQADIALYVAKRRGRDLVHIYSESDQDSENLRDTIEWIHQLQQAIANDQIVLHFQPVIEIRTREIAYYEALVRLNIDNKLIYPGSFIPALERADDIKLLDHQVVAKAIKYLADYPEIPRMAINLSAHAFSDEKLTPLIEQKMMQYRVDPKRIIFELTESASLTNLAGTLRMIERLTQLGCDFSIDDFGTGFSTFTYLKQLPAHSVKIDGSFVKDMPDDPIDLALVRAIHEIARSLNKVSVAEFVENQETLNLLEEIGVDFAQGYHIAKPAPIHTFLSAEVKALVD